MTSAPSLLESRATTPAATSPAAPIAASTPPVGSSSSASSRPRAMRAMRTNVSTLRLSALQRVAAHVGFEFGVLGVRALFELDQLARLVVEGGVGKAAEAAERFDQPFAGIDVAGVGHRLLAQEGRRRVGVVLRVDAEEGDALAVTGGELLQGRELEAAGPAPGGPEVDHDRVAPHLGDPLFEGAGAAGQQLVGLLVQGGEGRRRARQGLLVVGMRAVRSEEDTS